MPRNIRSKEVAEAAVAGPAHRHHLDKRVEPREGAYRYRKGRSVRSPLDPEFGQVT